MTETLTREDPGELSAASGGDKGQAPFSDAPTIAGYLVEGPLGHGGMAEVYKAQRLGTAGVPVPCVIKTILSGKVHDARFQQKFLAEARIHAQMSHPNLVQVLDVGRVDDRLFIVMEWIDGLDAADLVRSARKRRVGIPLRHVLFVLKQTLQGLHHAHTHGGQGFVHRDISPGNVLVSRQGAVKLADFGVARSAEALAADSRRTLAGKLHYFAPELVTGSAGASTRSDVFAMGVTFWEMLTCAPLFSRRARWPELRQEIASFDPRALLEKELTLPDGVEEIVLRCLAPRPESRYATALEFLEEVNDFAYESGLRLLDAHFAGYVERVLALRQGSTAESLGVKLQEEMTKGGQPR
ncbi:MAG: serine/threonine protein kinase [Deltaproteobacteria bacterium]|nr:serine/threonine protein kinase [Deltaproteobacteria bacterium]